MTQTEKILRHLQDEGSITPWEAVFNYNCLRLAARIADLKELGYPIKTAIESKRNEYGETVKYARYSLAKE